MKRSNTADQSMIEEVARMRKEGIRDFFCITEYYDTKGKRHELTPVIKHTAQGISAYANAMYRKYGDSVGVEVGYFDNDCEWRYYTHYHA